MLKTPTTAWAIVENGVTPFTKDGELSLWDSRLPLFWNRNVAYRVAREHGCTTSGPKQDVRVCRVHVRQFAGK